MPELPEVQTIASDLHEAVSGRVIEMALVSLGKIVVGDLTRFASLVTGSRIVAVKRLGKWLEFSLETNGEPATMLVHLKMTGQFHLNSWSSPVHWHPHDHAAFRLSGLPSEQNTLYYRDIRQFGSLRVLNAPELSEFLTGLGLGPDPLLVNPSDFFKRLRRRKGRLKCVLLDQTTVSGLGNIYVDEGLFAAKLSPLRSAATLTRTETDRLLTELKRILMASIVVRGSTTSNYQGLKGGGHYQKQLQVYGRTGAPCPVCAGGPIERSVVSGRSTHTCPRCQPLSKVKS